MRKNTIYLKRYAERMVIYSYHDYEVGEFVYIDGVPWKVWLVMGV